MKLVTFCILLTACGQPRSFHCTSDGQCVNAGVPGRCEADGFCSFPDVTCASGSRYGDHAAPDVRDTCVPPPINATCTAAEPIDVGMPHDGSLRAAPAALALSCSPLATGDVFYSLALAECSDLSVHAQADGGNLAVAVLGSCAAELGCADAHSSSEAETVEVDGLAPGTYQVAVAGVSYDGDFTVDAEIAPPPSNISPIMAMPITPPVQLEQSLARATDTAMCGTRTGGRDLYYMVTLPALANPRDRWTLTANIVSATSNDFAVSLTPVTTPACTPLAGGPANWRGLTPGNYLLAVDGPTDGSCGHFTLDLETTETPPNDLCTAPDIIGNGETTATIAAVDLDGATNDYMGSCGGTGNDVVFRVDTTHAEHLRITVYDPSLGSTAVPVVYLRPLSTTCDAATEASYTAPGTCNPTDPTQDAPDMVHTTACARGVKSAVLDLPGLPAGPYLIVVDSDTGGGTFVVVVEHIRPTDGLPTSAATINGWSDQANAGTCTVGTTIDEVLTSNLCSEGPAFSPAAFREIYVPRNCTLNGKFTLVSATQQDVEVTTTGACSLIGSATACGSMLGAYPSAGGPWFATEVSAAIGTAGVGGCNVIARVVGGPAGANFALNWTTDSSENPIAGCP
jgi:hypothetical protein